MQSSLVYVVVDNGVDVVVNGRAVRALVVGSNYDEVVDTDLSQGTSSMLSTLSWCMSSSTEHNDVVSRSCVVVVVVDVTTYIFGTRRQDNDRRLGRRRSRSRRSNYVVYWT
jgi:hypothetical protein